MVTLCYMPPTCAIGIHVILEEIGRPYELKKIDFAQHEHHKPEYLALNPKGKVPALIRDDGSVLTEFPAIAVWLALTNGEAGLLSTDPDRLARTLEAIDYVVATLHAQAWARFFRPQNFTDIESEQAKVKQQGIDMAHKGLKLLDKQLEGKSWLVGDYSIADCALFFFEFWSDRVKWQMPPNVAGHFARMKERPAVKRMLALQGLASAAA
jgi:glutathione S-transferase